MQAIIAVLQRDFKRLVSVPSALVVAVGIIIIPTLYAWFNTVGFWDPYGNTQHIPVAVVNEDSGARSTSLGNLNLGKDIVKELRNNTQLGWFTTSHDDALDQVRSGKAQAAIVIPQDFSALLNHLVEQGRGDLPTLQYYVNEKTNAVGTKITDTGSTTVDRQINDSFVSTAGKVIASTINKSADQTDTQSTAAKNAVTEKLDTTAQDIAMLRDRIADTQQTLSDVPQATQKAQETLTRLRLLNGSASDASSRLSTGISTTQNALNAFTQQSSGVLDKGAAQLAQASSQTAIAAGTIGAGLTNASQTIDNALATVSSIHQQTQDALETLQRALAAAHLPTDSKVLTDLTAANAHLGEQITTLQSTNHNAAQTVSSATSAVKVLDSTTQQSLNALDDARGTINTDGMSKLNTGMTSLASAAGTLAGGMQARNTLIDEVSQLLNQTSDAASSASAALGNTDKALKQTFDQIGDLRTEVSSISTSSALHDLLGVGGRLDTSKISEFMLSPTMLHTHMLYPVTTYGSGMAPLFMNLSLWVGAFALAVIMKLETDEEELDEILGPSSKRTDTRHTHLTSTQSFIAKYLFLAPFALAQGVLTAAGEIVIGVQTVNAPAMIATAALTSLVYLAIVFALSTSFMHIGKGLCVALIMLQIPGSAGLYPIEMMPGFFRAMHPFFPFTHAVAAFRETIGGFYDAHWGKELAILLLIGVVFFVFGLVVRPHLVNVNRLFARELAESDMVNVEPILLRGQEARIQQVLRALANHEEFASGITRRAERFTILYPKLKRAALIAGIVVPIAIVAILSLTIDASISAKVTALVIWLVWFIIIIGALMAMEITKDSIERQVAMGNLSDDALLELVEPHMGDALRRAHHA